MCLISPSLISFAILFASAADRIRIINATIVANIYSSNSPLPNAIGDGKKTIDNNLRTASRQSSRVILDLSRCKMHQSKVISRVRNYVSYPGHKFEKIIIITKSRKIIDFFENL